MQIQTKVPLLTRLTPYHQAKLAHSNMKLTDDRLEHPVIGDGYIGVKGNVKGSDSICVRRCFRMWMFTCDHNNCYRLDGTALEKCTRLYDETKGTVKHKRFPSLCRKWV